jgi:hypothetical protein
MPIDKEARERRRDREKKKKGKWGNILPCPGTPG